LRNLTDVHGPRLSGSPGFAAAANWAMEQLGNAYGLEKVHLEKWDPSDARGLSNNPPSN